MGFRAAFTEMYGDRLVRMMLFDSRARGDAKPDSDYDIAVLLAPLGDPWEERSRLGKLRFRFFDETDAFFDAKPYDAAAYRERTPLVHEIRREGLDL